MSQNLKTVEDIASAVARATPISKIKAEPFVDVALDYVQDKDLVVEMLRRIMFLVDVEKVRYEESMRQKRDANAERKLNG